MFHDEWQWWSLYSFRIAQCQPFLLLSYCQRLLLQVIMILRPTVTPLRSFCGRYARCNNPLNSIKKSTHGSITLFEVDVVLRCVPRWFHLQLYESFCKPLGIQTLKFALALLSSRSNSRRRQTHHDTGVSSFFIFSIFHVLFLEERSSTAPLPREIRWAEISFWYHIQYKFRSKSIDPSYNASHNNKFYC